MSQQLNVAVWLCYEASLAILYLFKVALPKFSYKPSVRIELAERNGQFGYGTSSFVKARVVDSSLE
jgi:hypothetical protein